MQIFVANPTLQNREFHYRMPGQKTTRVVKITAGGQEKLPDNLAGTELQYVIGQLERLGAVPASDIRAIVLPKAFIYDVRSNPIEVERIEEGLERDEDARQEVAAEKMEEAGLEAFKAAETMLASNGGRGRVIETSVEIVETTDRGKVKDGVNVEFVVSAKPNRRAGRKRTEDKI
jgi:hypothetical protein